MNSMQEPCIGERQLTKGDSGFFINHTQCFSPDGRWIVFDNRTDDAQIIKATTIGIVDIETGEVIEVYKTIGASDFGPGVGAATFSPIENKVLFLHGLRNASREKPYAFTRRTCVSIDLQEPFKPVYLDARSIVAPYTKGALRGGTHAHSSSGDGQWISFTYNDFVIEQLSKSLDTVSDLRTVGVMVPGRVTVESDDGDENFSGEMFSVVITEVTEKPEWGSDEIEKAFDECWIGTCGYNKQDGSKQRRAIAFQGHVREGDGSLKTEIFVVDLPDDIMQEVDGKPLQGTGKTRPGVPAGITQRRVTYSRYGVQGPRHWLRTFSDGSMIAFLSKDEAGLIQVFGISPNGGGIMQITKSPFSIQSPFNFSPDDKHIAFVADNSICIADVSNGTARKVGTAYTTEEMPVGAVVWSKDGKQIIYNRYVKTKQGRFPHIFVQQVFAD